MDGRGSTSPPPPKMKKIIDYIDYMVHYHIVIKIKILWLILKNRPFFKCPVCDGEGGHQSYWGEWYECICYDYWNELDDYQIKNEWFVGRLPLLQYIIARDHIDCHMVGISFIYYLKCKLGFHDIDYNDKSYGKGNGICKCCYKFFQDSKEVDYFDD